MQVKGLLGNKTNGRAILSTAFSTWFSKSVVFPAFSGVLEPVSYCDCGRTLSLRRYPVGVQSGFSRRSGRIHRRSGDQEQEDKRPPNRQGLGFDGVDRFKVHSNKTNESAGRGSFFMHAIGALGWSYGLIPGLLSGLLSGPLSGLLLPSPDVL
jgi:hypothetical protein